ncbi:hypothetical protein L0U85_17505 [Glycomyces sp. L485]|uniref:hypothetical protein n=1 Tax=Glycomyces sp. L485 TaxID=2909235 RepID=UPI001F4BBEB0|nr:hypothetical protein [Glycomyces sp. L485]MCH7232633.1 hypothetical protein [Glycomyces sp. L485]
MTHPDNQPPADDDGGTFKLKPSSQPKSEPAQGESFDSTMKLRKGGGASSAPPPPPPSPLGNPTGPANPPSPFAETSVMPQSGTSQTNFQPSTQAPGQQHPLGGQPTPPPPGQPYGHQQPPYGHQPPGQYPPQQGQQPYGQPGVAPGEAPEGVKRIGLVAMIGAGIGIVGAIASLAILGGLAVFSASVSILLSLAFGWYGFALPRGQINSGGLRMTGIVLIMIGAGLSLIGVLGGLGSMAIIGGAAALPLLLNLVSAGIYSYASFIYIKDEQVKAYIKGAPAQAAQGGYPPPTGQPGYPPPPGYPQQGQLPPQPPYGR